MHCIIIEDQPPAQRVLQKYIGDTPSMELAGTFGDALEAMEFLKSNPVDLIFLDIHLPKISGMDFLKILPNPPEIILTTAFSDYALEGYEFNVADYLLKPFSFERFSDAVEKVRQRRHESEADGNHEIFLKTGYDHVRVNINDIEFIQSDADYSKLFLSSSSLISSESLKNWLDYLDPTKFVRIHKSYIVNTGKIRKIRGNTVYMENGEELPIGRAFREDFVKRFLK